MVVAELITKLSAMPQDTKVICKFPLTLLAEDYLDDAADCEPITVNIDRWGMCVIECE